MELLTSCGKRFLIDNEDYPKLLNHGKSFFLGSRDKDRVYLYSRILKRNTLISRIIMNCPSDNGLDVDHKDRDAFNNLKNNLRWATFSQNRVNSSKKKGLSSIYKGVSFDKLRNKWKAGISINNKNKFLGRFITEIEAAIAYDDIAISIYGEFAMLNFPLYGA